MKMVDGTSELTHNNLTVSESSSLIPSSIVANATTYENSLKNSLVQLATISSNSIDNDLYFACAGTSFEDDISENRKVFYEHNKEDIEFYITLSCSLEDIYRRKNNLSCVLDILKNEDIEPNELILDIELRVRQLELKYIELWNKMIKFKMTKPIVVDYVDYKYCKFENTYSEVEPYEKAREHKNSQIAEKQNMQIVEKLESSLKSSDTMKDSPFLIKTPNSNKIYKILKRNEGDSPGPRGASGISGLSSGCSGWSSRCM